jgi:hypothetical protein
MRHYAAQAPIRKRLLDTLTLTESDSSPDALRTAGAAFSVPSDSYARPYYQSERVVTALYTADQHPAGPPIILGTIGLLPEDSEISAAAAHKDVDRANRPRCGSW